MYNIRDTVQMMNLPSGMLNWTFCINNTSLFCTYMYLFFFFTWWLPATWRITYSVCFLLSEHHIPALSHKPTAWRFLLILATSFTSLFSFFELVIIALLESRQSMWAAITLLVYITFLTKCVKCQTQNIVIILLNYICKWDFIVSIWMVSKNFDPQRIWAELNLLCSNSLQNKLTHFW